MADEMKLLPRIHAALAHWEDQTGENEYLHRVDCPCNGTGEMPIGNEMVQQLLALVETLGAGVRAADLLCECPHGEWQEMPHVEHYEDCKIGKALRALEKAGG